MTRPSIPDLSTLAWRALLAWLLVCALAAWPAPVVANTGDPDPTFGDDGTIDTDFADADDEGQAIALQPDGMVVVAGFSDQEGLDADGRDFGLARYQPDGSLDPGFGTAGLVLTDIAGDTDEAFAIVLQPDGKLVVAGRARTSGNEATSDFALARYDADGTLDPGFGLGGRVMTDFAGGQDIAFGVALQSDGKIVAAGGPNFRVVRYEPDGTLDATFGTGGRVTTVPPFPAGVLIGRAVVAQPDGKIVVAGRIDDNFGIIGGDNFVLVRYDSDGTLDDDFGVDGYVFTDFPSGHPDPLVFAQEEARALLLQPDGYLVAAGSVFFPNLLRVVFAMARYDTTGALDPSFGTGGRVTTAFPGSGNGIRGLALQPDGKIVAAGRGEFDPLGRNDFGIARYRADGVLDGSFGTCGVVSTNIVENDVGGSVDEATAVAVAPDGTILVTGNAFDINPELGVSQFDFHDFAVVRYRGGNPLTCSSVPVGGCRTPVEPEKSQLQIKDSAKDDNDRFKWSWQRGAALTFAELGDPRTTTDYTFCLYDESGPPRLVFEAPFPAADTCANGAPCWKINGDDAFALRDSKRSHCGIEGVKIEAGLAGKSKASVSGKGLFLPLPTLPLPLPLRAQLQASNGTCLEAVIDASGVTRNEPTQFKGRGD